MDEQNSYKENDFSVINYRLTAIEKEIKSLKDLLVTVPLLTNQLETITKTFEEKTNAIENKVKQNEVNNDLMATEITKIKTDIVALKNDHKTDITALKNEIKNEHLKKDAGKWNKIIDIAFKAIVGAFIAWAMIPWG